MKLRFYPKTAVVRSYLETQKADLVQKLDRLEGELAKAKEPRALYVDTTALTRELGGYQGLVDGIQDKLDLLASHGPEEVMMELDIA